MKSKMMSGLSSILLASLIIVFAGCDKDNDDVDNIFAISGTASGSQEVPAVTTNATGTLTGSYNETTNSLSYNISWSDLSVMASAGHFHGPANVGEIAGPVVTLQLNNNGTSGTASGTSVLTETQEDDLLGGRWYYNIHTPTFPDGEIRAQVVITPQ